MAPLAGSRQSFAAGERDEVGQQLLTEREPYGARVTSEELRFAV